MNRTLIALIIGFLALITFVCLIGDDTEQQLAYQGCNGYAAPSCSGVSGCSGSSAGCAGASYGCSGASRGLLRGRRPLRSFGGRLLRGCS